MDFRIRQSDKGSGRYRYHTYKIQIRVLFWHVTICEVYGLKTAADIVRRLTTVNIY